MKTREAVGNKLDELRGGGYFATTTDLWSSSTSEALFVTLCISSITTGSYAVKACKPCLCQSNILARTLIKLRISICSYVCLSLTSVILCTIYMYKSQYRQSTLPNIYTYARCPSTPKDQCGRTSTG